MTFSDKKLSRRLRRDYHLVWENIDGDQAAGSSFAHDPRDKAGDCPIGAGEHNVQLLILDEWGRVLNAVAGFVDAASLGEELDLAEDLHRQIKKQKKQKLAARLVKKRHEKERRRDLKSTLEKQHIFARLTRQRRAQDHRYCAKHPLQTYKTFRTKDMVGSGSSFFGTAQGQLPKDRIGDIDGADNLGKEAREMLDALRRGRGTPSDEKSKDRGRRDTKKRKRPTSRPTSLSKTSEG